MLDCMSESKDAVPATIRSVIQGYGEFGIKRLERAYAPGAPARRGYNRQSGRLWRNW